MDGEAPMKDCPECGAEVPLATRECPLCGYVWEHEGLDAEPMSDFVMSEIDLLKRSAFRWCDLFGDDSSLLATGFTAWAGIFFLNGRWHSVGGMKGEKTRLLSMGERTVCLASADDWLNDNETDETAHKSRSWHHQPATPRQLQYLPSAMRNDYGLTRYRAAAMLTFQFNKEAIRTCVQQAAELKEAA
ncbi:MAG: zinc ribbon domain-containing protein [Oricola sp.]|nr:zinc ribbon domain-containing protein [Oricola sp.]